ncbi:MAG: 30S ribosomal protein S12 methylthiotransferase RimO [Lachnospiraceae bacterium]|nr:30S ribosomal protein S12 methylthiotransferase RimO [Lachnospiraceae bacterium]
MKILFISLGCDKNLVDSEHMLGKLSSRGHVVVDDETEAEAIVVNTCAFIHDAKEESVSNILEMAEYRKDGKCRCLIVTGCLAERYRQEILDEIPEVDAVIGTNSYDEILTAIESCDQGERSLIMKPLTGLPDNEKKRLMTTGGHYEYLKIAEGCEKHCTYCIIPKLRGKFRSVPMEELLEEATEMASQGVRELILVAQETTIYGKDIYGEKSLHILLKKLCEIPGIRWIRVLYCYPEEIYPELIQVMRDEPKICHYLDLPIQHCNDTVLKRMGRRTTKQELIDIITELRRQIPDIVLRTSLITGFPGETEEQHEEMMEFVDEIEFDRLGVFTYSPEEGTPAAEFPDQIDEETKLDWQDEILSLQQEVSYDNGTKRIGQELDVVVEGYVPNENAYVCRTYADTPGVDGYFFLNTDETLNSGDFVKARVTGAEEYDLIGDLVEAYDMLEEEVAAYEKSK